MATHDYLLLFTNKQVHIVKSPILIASKGKQRERFYAISDFDQDKYKGWTVQYFKGLGSLSEDEYEIMINDPILEQVVLDDSAEDSLNIAFGEDANLRKLWLAK